MAYNGNEKKDLTFQEARTMYQEATASELENPTSVYFSRTALLDILAQPDCVGIRFLLCEETIINKDESTEVRKNMMAVGVDSEENELTENQRMSVGFYPCPPECTETGNDPEKFITAPPPPAVQ